MRVLIIDDQEIFASSIAKKLKRNGYDVHVLHSVTDFKELGTYDYDLYLVDLSLNDGTGFDIISLLREEKKIDTPIIIISGFSHVERKVQGLDLGADDYLQKPFLPEELEARIRAIMRRKSGITTNSIIKHKSIKLNIATSEVTIVKEIIPFTKKEKSILEFFLFNKGKLMKKKELIKSVWSSSPDFVSDNTINVTISKIRKKLGKDFDLETKIGEGYILHK